MSVDTFEDPLDTPTPFEATDTRCPEPPSSPGNRITAQHSPPLAPELPPEQPPRRSHRQRRSTTRSHSAGQTDRPGHPTHNSQLLGLPRSYRTRPTFDPDSFVTPEDLAKASDASNLDATSPKLTALTTCTSTTCVDEHRRNRSASEDEGRGGEHEEGEAEGTWVEGKERGLERPLSNLVDAESQLKKGFRCTLKNRSQAAPSTWQHSGSTQKSNEEVQELVDVLLDPTLKLAEFKRFNALWVAEEMDKLADTNPSILDRFK